MKIYTVYHLQNKYFFEHDKMVAGTDPQVINRFIVSQILSESLVIHVRTIISLSFFFVLLLYILLL